MNRLIAGVFKAIIISSVMIIVADLTLYIGRAYALDYKVKALMSSMMQDISKNNYLSEDGYNMYTGILEDIKNTDPELVQEYKLNWKNTGSVNDDLSVPKNYGDSRDIELRIAIARTGWGSKSADSGVHNLDDLEKGYSYTVLKYNNLVPCLRYVK